MAKEFNNKYIVRYSKGNNPKYYGKFEITPLSILDVPNPDSQYFKDDVLNTYNWYENVKSNVRNYQTRDGEIIADNETYWLLVECAGIRYANEIFWRKFDEFKE